MFVKDQLENSFASRPTLRRRPWWFTLICFYLFHHFPPALVLSWHNHLVNVKQSDPIIPYHLQILGQTFCCKRMATLVLWKDLPVHVSVETIIVRNQLIQSLFLFPPFQLFDLSFFFFRFVNLNRHLSIYRCWSPFRLGWGPGEEISEYGHE